MVVGPRRSGKGTIGRTLTALLGRDSVIAPTLSGLQSNFGLAPLIAKSLAIISDARVGGKSDQAVIAERLLSISGEDAITIDRKHQSAWTGRLPVRFMVLTNELPRIADNSNALAGRFIVLLLQHSFYGCEDLGLAHRLAAETTGILNWALVGYRRLRKNGHFIQPASASEAIEELEALGSPIKAYIRERCRIEPGCAVPGRAHLAGLAGVVRGQWPPRTRNQAQLRRRTADRRAGTANLAAERTVTRGSASTRESRSPFQSSNNGVWHAWHVHALTRTIPSFDLSFLSSFSEIKRTDPRVSTRVTG